MNAIKSLPTLFTRPRVIAGLTRNLTLYNREPGMPDSMRRWLRHLLGVRNDFQVKEFLSLFLCNRNMELNII